MIIMNWLDLERKDWSEFAKLLNDYYVIKWIIFGTHFQIFLI